jgi:D-alanyl-D-alanine dipeptidase
VKLPKRMKQAFTSPPRPTKGAAGKPGKKKTDGHRMGGAFGQFSKRSEPDNTPRVRQKERAQRMKRLDNKFI